MGFGFPSWPAKKPVGAVERLMEYWGERPGLRMCYRPWERDVDVEGTELVKGWLVMGADMRSWTVSDSSGILQLYKLGETWDSNDKPDLGVWRAGSLKFNWRHVVSIGAVGCLGVSEYLTDKREAAVLAIVRHFAVNCDNPGCGWALLLNGLA